MRKALFLAILGLSTAGLGCNESTGGGANPKAVGDSKLQPLPKPGSPSDLPAPKTGKAATSVPGGGAGAE